MKILAKFKNAFKKNKSINQKQFTTRDEKIGYLANELIKELKISGKSIDLTSICEGFGSVDISVYDLGAENESMTISCVINGWEVKAKPTFKEF